MPSAWLSTTKISKDYLKSSDVNWTYYNGLPKEQERADVIAYLRTMSDAPQPLP